MGTQDLGGHTGFRCIYMKYVDSLDFGRYTGFRWAQRTCMGTLQAILGTNGWVVLKTSSGQSPDRQKVCVATGGGGGV